MAARLTAAISYVFDSPSAYSTASGDRANILLILVLMLALLLLTASTTPLPLRGGTMVVVVSGGSCLQVVVLRAEALTSPHLCNQLVGGDTRSRCSRRRSSSGCGGRRAQGAAVPSVVVNWVKTAREELVVVEHVTDVRQRSATYD